MLTAADVQRVARTAQPHTVAGHALTIDDVIKLTTGDDWDGALYELHLRPATEIAVQFNVTHGLAPTLSLTKPAGNGNRRNGRKAVAAKPT